MTGERGQKTEVAIKAHLHSLGQGIDSIMEGYADDAILLTPEGIYQGTDAIHEFYQGFIQDTLPLLAASFSLLRFDVAGEAAYLTWAAEPSIPTGSETMLVHEGKIVLHTKHMYMKS